MERTAVNPWKWQDQYGFVQAYKMRGATETIVCSGQTAIDAEGNPRYENDMAGQLKLTIDNLEAVLETGGFKLSDVVKLTIYTTNVPLLMENYAATTERLLEAGCVSAQTLLGITSLAFPDLMVEIEAMAAK